MKISYIYKITNLTNNKAYIGFTQTPDMRWHEHKSCEHYETMPLHKAIKNEGAQNFKFEILYKSKNVQHTLFVMEPYFIGLHKTHVSENGYNKNYGGDHPYLKRDGYTLLLESQNFEPEEPKINSTIFGDVVPEKSAPFIKRNKVSSDTKSILDDEKQHISKYVSDTECAKPNERKVFDLIKRIQIDGTKSIGKWYLAHDINIVCFNNRKKLIRYVEDVVKISPTRLLRQASELNKKTAALSWSTMRDHHCRGVYLVYVTEKTFSNSPQPPPPSKKKIYHKRHQDIKDKSLEIVYKRMTNMSKFE